MITYLNSKEIVRSKWDECIAGSVTNLVYGYSWYLDMVSPGWSGLVEDDYASVMPLPVKRKYGINYIIQPPLTQQLGIFSAKKVNSKAVKDFIERIPHIFKFTDLHMNHGNDLSGLSILHSTRINMQLDLSSSYEDLSGNYSDNTKRNVAKAKSSIAISENPDLTAAIELIRKYLFPGKKDFFYSWIESYISKIILMGYGFSAGALHNDRLCAFAFFINFSGRIYYMIPVSDTAGKEQRAMFALVDHVIRKYSRTPLILDFEGSNIQGIARFYKGFGAENIHYPRIRIMRIF